MNRCESCGAKVVEYKHNLNKGLAKGLILLDKAGGSAMLRDLNLTKPQYNNFQKLRYWGLIEKTEGTSAWAITEKGSFFVHGDIHVNKSVITYRGKTVGFDGPEIGVEEVLGEYSYWWREQYIKHQRPHIH